MKSDFFMEMISLIRREEQRRASLTLDHDQDFLWQSKDEPFIAELCLMILVALWHWVERELIVLAARAETEQEFIFPQQLQARVKELRKGTSWNWDIVKSRLKLESCREYQSTQALRHLANSRKHAPSGRPDEALIKVLDLPEANYAPSNESSSLRERLALSVGLEKEAGYLDIVEQFVNSAEILLKDVESRTRLSSIARTAAPFNPSLFEE